jgi:transposase
MASLRKKFNKVGFDEIVFKRHFHNKQAEYIRKRLRSVELFSKNESIPRIAKILNLHEYTVRSYISTYINEGFEPLCAEIVRKQPCLLTEEQELAFKEVILTKSPEEMGLEGNIWTGNIMKSYIQLTYGVTYNSGIYWLLKRLNLSHQKAHSDYDNAKESDQIAFLEDLKTTLLEADETTAVIKFDEFSICEKPSNYYGWAEKNTRPKVKTDEKKEKEQTDF